MPPENAKWREGWMSHSQTDQKKQRKTNDDDFLIRSTGPVWLSTIIITRQMAAQTTPAVAAV